MRLNRTRRRLHILRSRYSLEPAFWLAALVALALADPAEKAIVDLCLFKQLGIVCPGCGLGHGIAHLLELNFPAAIEAHPLSPFAVGAMVARVRTLFRRSHITPATA